MTIIVTNGSMALDYINKKYLLPFKSLLLQRPLGQDFEISLVLPEDIKEEW